MSRVPKWKVEKTKVKVVFRLQFQATHIPPGWDKLFLSLIPCDTGKATAKTTKTNVRNGNCKWSDPIYETTRLLLDTRTKKYDEKLYKLVIATGSSRSSLLGEVNINLADFADASKPSSFQLPLQSCDFGTILHATVQLLTSKTGFREFEQQREASVKGFQTTSVQRSPDPVANLVESSDTTNEQIDKVNSRVRFKEGSVEPPSLEVVRESNEDFEDSGAGTDGPSSISHSSHTGKSDTSNVHSAERCRNTTGDVNPSVLKPNRNAKTLSAQVNNHQAHGLSSDYSVDNDILPAHEENNELRVRLEVAESAFVQLKLEASSLQRITEELGAETQSLTQQLVAELASGEKLAREVSLIKSECSKLKNDLEDMKSAKTMHYGSHNAPFSGLLEANPVASGQNHREVQLKCLQGLLLIEGKVREIQDKACPECHGSGFDLHPDFEVLEYFIQNLREGITQTTSSELVDGTWSEDIQTTMSDTSTNEKMRELLERLEESNIEKGNLARKMDEMECYYEALIQELELSHKQTLNNLENLRVEHASCLYTVSALQNQIEKMHQDMNEQLIRFAEDMHTLESQNKEFENRAIASETALTRVRSNNSIAVNRLQKDLELLSFQVMSMYETNESLAKQACTDESRLLQGTAHANGWKLEDTRQVTPEIQRNIELPDISILKDKHADNRPLDDKHVSEETKSSLHMPRELHPNSEHELSEMHASTMHSEVYSLVLRETLYDVTDEVVYMKDQIDQLKKHLKHSTDVKESLMLRLHTALDDVSLLKENENKFTSKIEDLALKNCILEAKIQDLLEENSRITQKVVENERLMVECRAVENKYKTCDEDRQQIENLLKQESLGKKCLQVELQEIAEKLKSSLEAEEKHKIQNREFLTKVTDLEVQLQNATDENRDLVQKLLLLEGVNEELERMKLSYTNYMQENRTLLMSIQSGNEATGRLEDELSRIKESLRHAHDKLQIEVNFRAELEAEVADLKSQLNEKGQQLLSFNERQTELVQLRKRILELETENSGLDNLLLQSDESQRKFREQHEAEVVDLTSQLEKKVQELVSFDEQNAELLRITNRISDVETENHSLQLLLKQSEESKGKLREQHEADVADLTSQLEKKVQDLLSFDAEMLRATKRISDLESENGSLQQLLTESEETRGKLREQHEAEVADITSQLEKKVKELLSFDELNAELLHIMERVSDLQTENNSLQQLLSQSEEGQEKLREQHEAEVTDLTSQLEKKVRELLSFVEQNAELLLVTKRISDLETENHSLQQLLTQSEEGQEKLREQHEAEVADLTSQLEKKVQELLSSDEQNAELLLVTKRILDLETENHSLQQLLTQSEEGQEKLREQHEAEVTDLTSQLEKKAQKLLSFDGQNAELLHFRKMISDLETENNSLQQLLTQSEETQGELSEQHDAEVAHLTSQLEKKVQELRTFDEQNAELFRFTKMISDLETENNSLHQLLAQCEESQGKLREQHEVEVADLMSQMEKKVQELLTFDEQNAELLRITKLISDLETENNSFQQLLTQSHESQGKLREQHEAEVANLTSQLEKKVQELLYFDEKNAELLLVTKRISDLETENDSLHKLLTQSEESQGKLSEQHEAEVANLTSQLEEKIQMLVSFDEIKDELLHITKKISDLETENIRLQHLLSQSEEEQINCRQDLEAEVADLKSQLEKEGLQFLSFEEQKAQIVHLEKENFQLQRLLHHSEEIQRKLNDELLLIRLQVTELENRSEEFLEYSLTRDVDAAYMTSRTKAMERSLEELHLRQLDSIASLEVCKASEARSVEKNRRLSAAVESMKSECATITCEKDDLVENLYKRNTTVVAATIEADSIREKQNYADEISQLNIALTSFEKEVENLWSSRAELEVTKFILTSKLDEQQSRISFLELSDCELRKLREQYNDLSHKLSEQILKTEEFKNLSTHLRELKDKADTESHQVPVKKENGGPPPVKQESLRIAFIKEQYESKLQDLRNQVFVSKKYAEEMLLKLQDALNEAESAKRSETSLAKRNEELTTKVLELEAEFQTSVADRRELVKAYDRMTAELECAVLSLDCCKEEKLKLEGTLQECNEERTKIRVELDLVKRLLENMVSITDMHDNGDLEPGPPNATSIGQLLGDNDHGFAALVYSTKSASTIDRDQFDDDGLLSPCKEVEDTNLACSNGSTDFSPQMNLQSLQGSFILKSALEQQALLKDNKKHIIDIKAHQEEQKKLRTGMDLLLKELERLKNDNLSSLLPPEESDFNPSLQGLQRELTQLDMANEHLISIFPLFKELPVNGNALERVLALELELAEALQSKKKPDDRFQSSFLKQHSDEEAVYQSFRDINDLIKDMLELKKRKTIVETELKEMHDRYSQLSLRFAEVEGERQKLVMTLKNRTPRKSQSFPGRGMSSIFDK